MPHHSSRRLGRAVRAAMAVGIVMLLTACGGGGGGVTSYNQYCAEPGCNAPVPPAPNSRFVWTFVGQGKLTRTPGGCSLSMPKVEIQETAGYGGYLDGSSARIYLTDGNGTIRMLDRYLTLYEVKNQLGVDRYEGKAKRTVELAFEVPVSPAARDPLRGVDWTIFFTDDTHAGGSIAITVPLDRVDLSPGD